MTTKAEKPNEKELDS